MSGRGLRIILVAAAFVLAAGLFLAPSQVNFQPQKSSAIKAPSPNFDFESLIKTAKGSLDDERKGFISALEMTLSAHPDSIALYDSIGKAWDASNIPAVSAYYYEQKAEKVQAEKNYLDAAYRYFDAYKIAEDTALKSLMVQKAMVNYEKVLEKNPANLDAKTDLGICYAEGTAEPMKGIMMLRDVVTANPNHEMAQFNLGLLSLKSTQYAKAIDRFDKVIAINPKRSEAYLYKGQTYLQMGDTAKAIESLDLYKTKSDNYEMIQQVSKLLEELKKAQQAHKAAS